MPEDIDSHVEELLNIIKEKTDQKVTKKEVKEEFERFMDYGVPIAQAKQTILKKYGEEATVFTGNMPSERTKITDLEADQSSVKIIGHVLAINPKEITVKGENRTIFYGILEDETGTIPFTSWTDVDMEKGDVVEISNAYTKEWQGNVQLNIGDRVQINKTDKSKLPKKAFEPKKTCVGDLRSGMGRVEVTAKVLEINKREVTVDGSSKSVFSGIIADESGKAQFTSWHDFKIKKDDVINISGGYVKSWKGIPQLTFDVNAKFSKLNSKKISLEDIKVRTMPMFKLEENKGGLDIEIEGTIIDIRPGSGFILRCSECKRTLQNNECSEHGKVNGEEDLRLKLIVDDGSGAVNAIINKELTEKLLEMKMEEVKKLEQADFERTASEKIFANKVSLKGNALSDRFGITFITKKITKIDQDIKTDAEKLLNELEEM